MTLTRAVSTAGAALALLSTPTAVAQSRMAPHVAHGVPVPRFTGPVVRTSNGFYLGETVGGDVSAFRGIRYAAPPVGSLRWRPPAEAPKHEGLRDARSFGPDCLQFDDAGQLTGSEDCLTLNVFTPAAGPPPASRPILFFVHGGGNVQGSSRNPLYAGQHLARKEGAVVVTASYRLSALGFFAHPFLDLESPRSVSGNYGILDLLAALEWTRENAAAFGGDPDRLLLFGESAGAVNTCSLLASPLASGLFSAALMQSGGCAQPPLADVEGFGQTIVEAAGCARPTLAEVSACMRSLSPEAVTSAVPGEASVVTRIGLYGPAVDGWVLPASPYDALVTGTHNHVPFAIGSNADETSRAVPPMTAAVYAASVTGQFGPLLGALILQKYPAASYPSPREAYVALTTDSRFVCPSRRIARAAAGGQSEPVFRYFFTHVLDSSPSQLFGAFHGLELAFVFGTLVDIPDFTPSPAEIEMSGAMGAAWTSLARTGQPSAPGLVWNPYDPVADTYARFGEGVGTGAGVRTEVCDFWDTLVGSLGR